MDGCMDGQMTYMDGWMDGWGKCHLEGLVEVHAVFGVCNARPCRGWSTVGLCRVTPVGTATAVPERHALLLCLPESAATERNGKGALRMHGCMDGYAGVCMYGWMHVWVYGWMHGWMHGWMDGWMDIWMDVKIDGLMNVHDIDSITML